MSTLERPSQVTNMHHAPVSASGPRAASFGQLLALACASAALLWASFFPLNWGWFAWFALVPLLGLVRSSASPRRIYGAALLGGYLFAVAALKWMRVAHPMMVGAWFALAFYIALYFPIAVWLMRRLDRAFRLPLAAALPIVWVSLEYLRAHFLGGFAWYFLGHTQHDYLAVIQIADLGGVYAVSFVVAAVNGLVFDLVTQWHPLRAAIGPPRRRLVAVSVAVGLLTAGTIGYGALQLRHPDFEEGPRVAVLQTNIPQDVKNSKNGSETTSSIDMMFRHTEDLTNGLLREHANPDLIVWPETTFPEDWIEITPGTPASDLPYWALKDQEDVRRMAGRVATHSHAAVLLGLNTLRLGAGLSHNRYNSALLIGKDGVAQDRYDKIHCVPFGEYVPARETLPWMEAFSPYEKDYSLTPGASQTRLTLRTERKDFHFGALICYEDSDAVLARRFGRPEAGEPPVDFLVNISNDGWFNGTEEHELHMAVCRFRAVESRRAVVRSVNMGISAVIDADGRVVALPGPSWRESKKIAATFTASVPIDHRVSLYAYVGDWVPAVCAMLLGVGLFAGLARRRPATALSS